MIRMVHVADGLDAGLDVVRELLPVALGPLLGAVVHPAVRPEGAVADLIAHLDDLGLDTGVAQGLDHVVHVGIEGIHALLVGHVAQARRRGLGHRVGPAVGHHEVQGEVDVVLFEFLRAFHHVLEGLAEAGGLVADHQASPVVAMVPEDPPGALLRAVGVVPHAAALLGAEHEREVLAEGVRIVIRELPLRESHFLGGQDGAGQQRRKHQDTFLHTHGTVIGFVLQRYVFLSYL